MDGNSKPTPTRRALLSALAGGLAASSVGRVRGTESRYALVQGERCEPIRPIRGELSVEEFYDYRLPEKYVSDENGASAGSTAQYASAGTEELQRDRTSVAFLYRGPDGLSLVVVHGHVGSSNGGSVTFRMAGMPSDGRWAVKDDLYRNPDTGETASTNYDRWRVDGSEHRVNWTWGSAGTDGGAFRGLGDDFAVTVEPSFNEAAALFGEHYEGTVTNWQFLSGSADGPERISLALDEPIRIETGGCGRDGGEEHTKEKDEEEREREGEKEHEEEREREGEDGPGKSHENGKGKGHENGNGEGHEKHGDDDDEDDEDKDDD